MNVWWLVRVQLVFDCTNEHRYSLSYLHSRKEERQASFVLERYWKEFSIKLNRSPIHLKDYFNTCLNRSMVLHILHLNRTHPEHMIVLVRARWLLLRPPFLLNFFIYNWFFADQTNSLTSTYHATRKSPNFMHLHFIIFAGKYSESFFMDIIAQHSMARMLVFYTYC